MGRFTLRVNYTGDKPGDAPQGSGTAIAKDWSALIGTAFTRNLDAACKLPNNPNDLYLFKGDTYLRYNLPNERIVDGPTKIANTGRPSRAPPSPPVSTRAGVPGSSSDIYIFGGARYIRVDP